MSSSSANGDIAANTGTSFIVALPYQSGGAPVTGSYAQVVRLGAWDTTIEQGLVNAGGNKIVSASGTNTAFTGDDNPLQDKGILLYSADQITSYAPTIRTVGQASTSSWSNQNMTITTDDSNNVVAYSFAGPAGITANYQKLDAISMIAGFTSSFVFGNAMTVWSGNDASTGLGGLLWSNIGLTQNIFDGQVVNINSADLSVQGLGATSLSSAQSMVATTSIDLAVNPVAAGAAATAQTVARYMSQITRFAAVISAGAAPLILDAVTTYTTDKMAAAEKDIGDSARAEFDTALTISSLIIAVQAIASLSGITLAKAAKTIVKASPAGKLSLGLANSSLSQTPASTLTLTPATMDITTPGVTITTSSFRIACGAAVFEMTPASIELSVGGVTGIVISAIDLNFAGPQNNFE